VNAYRRDHLIDFVWLLACAVAFLLGRVTG